MANTPNLNLIELTYDNTKKVKDFFINEIIGKTNSNNTKIDTAIAEKITQVALKSSLPTSPNTSNNLYIVYGDTKNNNGQYRWNGTTYEKISTQLDYATKAEAEAGADNTKVMTPQRVRDFFIANGGGSGGVTNVVFQSGKKYYKFTATAITDNFEIPSNLFNPTTDVIELIHGGNIPLIKDENYTLVGNLVTFIGYSLDTNDDIHCLITNTAYSYNALVDTPDLTLKQNKTDNTLGTTSKEIVGAINENKYNIDLKADKPIVIGGSGNIRLIGEIVNYTTFNGFNLEAMLHNAHQTNFSQTNNAFIAIGKYDNNTAIEGKLQMLYDTVYNNPSGYYKSTIQVTDTGKIYAINETYMTASSWNIIKKTVNVVIYNNPTIVSSIDGNVIWDSELNKTNIATSQQMEQKADKESPQFTGTPTINGNEIATVNNIPAGLSLGETSSTAYRGDKGKVAYDHSQSAHAPSNAQKNSDITKSEIEAKLIGDISTHYHASDSTKAPTMHAVADGTYGLGTYSAYGHVKTYQGLDFLGADAYALHANQGKVLKDLIDTKTKVVTGTYTGDDMAARFINLGFTPKAVFVFPRRWQNIYNIYGLAVSGSPSITSSITQNNISVETNGFNIYAGPGDIYTQTAASTNRTGYEYNYVAIG